MTTAAKPLVFRNMFYTFKVHPNRVEITDRSGCIGMLFMRRKTLAIRNIAFVDALPTGMLLIRSNDGQQLKFGTAGHLAKQVKQAIEERF